MTQGVALGWLVCGPLALHRSDHATAPREKLLLGHAAVLEALLRRRGSRAGTPIRSDAEEAELPRQVRSQAGAWEQGGRTFAPDYQSFEVLDFDKKRRITGKRVPYGKEVGNECCSSKLSLGIAGFV